MINFRRAQSGRDRQSTDCEFGCATGRAPLPQTSRVDQLTRGDTDASRTELRCMQQVTGAVGQPKGRARAMLHKQERQDLAGTTAHNIPIPMRPRAKHKATNPTQNAGRFLHDHAHLPAGRAGAGAAASAVRRTRAKPVSPRPACRTPPLERLTWGSCCQVRQRPRIFNLSLPFIMWT